MPAYEFDAEPSSERVFADIALIELQHPVRNTTIIPFVTGERPLVGDNVGVVSPMPMTGPRRRRCKTPVM